MAAMAEERKKAKYELLDASHSFVPVAVETAGVFGPLTHAFLKDLGVYIVIIYIAIYTLLLYTVLTLVTGEEKSYSYLVQRVLTLVTGEEKSYSYLVQRVSVAIQRGNAASVVGTMGQLGIVLMNF